MYGMCPYIINWSGPTGSLHRAFPACIPTHCADLTGLDIFEGLPHGEVSPMILPVNAVG